MINKFNCCWMRLLLCVGDINDVNGNHHHHHHHHSHDNDVDLHLHGNGVPLGENLTKVPSSQNIPGNLHRHHCQKMIMVAGIIKLLKS